MWGLRDACTLHGLRCGAYITLTREGGRCSERDGAAAVPTRSATDEPLGEPDPSGARRRERRRTTAARPEAPRTALNIPPQNRSVPRRTGGGAPEAHRHTAAR